MTITKERYASYLRPNALPSVWCPGCGNGVIVRAILEAVDDADLAKDDVALIGGIGCSGRTPFLPDLNTMHTTHGRALAFATGLKMARPDLTVLVTMGDGDSSGIGGNHLIHAARRNIDLTAIVFDNGIYGQTGGQAAPTTPAGHRTTTTPQGNADPSFDLCDLVQAAGATFVARGTVLDRAELKDILDRALAHPGFSFVDVHTPCPTYHGRLNRLGGPHDMLLRFRDTTAPPEAWRLEPEPGAPKVADPAPLPTGILVDEDRPEFVASYRQRARSADP